MADCRHKWLRSKNRGLKEIISHADQWHWKGIVDEEMYLECSTFLLHMFTRKWCVRGRCLASQYASGHRLGHFPCGHCSTVVYLKEKIPTRARHVKATVQTVWMKMTLDDLRNVMDVLVCSGALNLLCDKFTLRKAVNSQIHTQL